MADWQQKFIARLKDEIAETEKEMKPYKSRKMKISTIRKGVWVDTTDEEIQKFQDEINVKRRLIRQMQGNRSR